MNIREIQSASIVDLLSEASDAAGEKLININFKKTVWIKCITTSTN